MKKKKKTLRNCGKITKKVFSSLFDLLLNVLIHKIKQLTKRTDHKNSFNLKHHLRLIQYLIQRLEIYFGEMNTSDSTSILEKFRKVKKVSLIY